VKQTINTWNIQRTKKFAVCLSYPTEFGLNLAAILIIHLGSVCYINYSSGCVFTGFGSLGLMTSVLV
jgi:hypothetical protein